MSVEWTEAPKAVIELAGHIIARYHEHLLDARIAFIMRSEAPVSNGQVTYAKARKVPADQQVHIDYDFIIWLALDRWKFLSPKQKEALVDHELMHCQWDGLTASLRGHDVEEFTEIIERYGFWQPESDKFAVAVQHALPLASTRSDGGSVGTIDFGRIAKEAGERMRAEGMDVEVTHFPSTARGN